MMTKAARTALYYVLTSAFIIVGLIIMLSFKAVWAIVGILIHENFKAYLGSWSWFVGGVIGFVTAAVWFALLQAFVFPYVLRIHEHAKQFRNKVSYIALYGRDFPQPKIEDYGITREEFDDYNKRFQFEFIRFLMSYGVVIGAAIYVGTHKLNKDIKLLLLLSGIVVGLSISFFLKHLNKKISMKHRYYPKIKEYQDACDKYFKGQREIFSYSPV